MQEKNIQGHLVAVLVVIIWATNYVYFQSSVTLIVASIFLEETITPMAVGGVLLLIFGMVLAQRKPSNDLSEQNDYSVE